MFETTAEELVLGLQQTTERVEIRLTVTGSDTPVDATALSFMLTDLGGNIVYQDNLFAPPSGGTRIVHPSTGRYYIALGGTEMRTARDLLAVWHIEVGDDADNVIQTMKIVSPYMIDLVGTLRRQIDKARKKVVEDLDHPCDLGYTTKGLIECLEGGLQTWNMYEPYPTFCGLGDFPRMYKQGLIEAALVVGIQMQELFAIDMDIPNYSAQGAAFVIQHQPQLAAFATRIAQKLDKLIPIAKLKFVQSGSLHTEIAPNARLQTLINMAPNGALFRNMFLAGG